ncbi:hypothetical protein GCM10023310_46790 [Paenibacillus vulneris]
MRKALRMLEWILVISLLLQIMMLAVRPYISMNSYQKEIREAKRLGSFYEGGSETQLYFGKKLRVNGVIYGGQGELSVYMTGTGKNPNKLPNRVLAETDSGIPLTQRGYSSTNTAFRSEGNYLFSDVPQGVHSVRIFSEAYGESFSFMIPLTGGDVR